MTKVLLTGVTKGLGKAMWDEFHTQGCSVAGCGRSEFPADVPAGSSFHQVDITSDSAVGEWVKAVCSEEIPQLVVNNAAIINKPAPLWRVQDTEMQAVLDINVRGTVNVIRHVTPHLIETGRGVIVNFSSGWGRSASPEVGPYCASKFAIEGLSQSLAQDLASEGKQLACVAVNPGVIHTEMLETVWGQDAVQFGSTEVWAPRAVRFLLDLGPGMNGRSLSI